MRQAIKLQKTRALMLLSTSFLLAGCGLIPWPILPCSTYNGPRDRFDIAFADSSISLPVGEERTVVLETRWYADDGVTESQRCEPDYFETEPDRIVDIDPATKKIRGIAAGEATLRVIVTGSGGTKSAETSITVY